MKSIYWITLSAALFIASARADTAPTIASLSNSQTFTQGQSLSLSVSVNGTSPFSYQWKKGGVAITGATASTYSIAALATTDAGAYTVTVTNSVSSITSPSVLVDVTPATAPSFYYQPNNLTYTEGETINFYASVNGTSPMTFVWKNGTTTLATTTSYSYSKAGAQSSDAGTYTVTVSNAAGSVTSASFTVTVNPLTKPVVSGPSSTTVNPGDTISLYVSAANSSGLTWQWYKDGVAITGANSNSYYRWEASAADAGSYTATATNSAGSTSSTAAVVTVRAAVAPTVATLSSGPITVTTGETLNLYASGNGTAPLSYQWRKDGVAIAGATSSSYYKTGVTVDDTGTYSVVVSNSVGSLTSGGTIVSVTSARAPIITRHPASIAVYPGDYISLGVDASGTGQLSFQWAKDGTNIPGASSSYYSDYSAAASDAGVYTVVVSSTQGSVTSQPANVTVLPPQAPTITVQPAGAAISPGQTISVSVSATGRPAPTYQWKKDGADIAGANGSSFYKDRAASSDSGSYSVVVTNSAGSVTSAAATVNVGTASAPVILYHPASASVLPGEWFSGLSIVYANPYATGTTIKWYHDDVEIPSAIYDYYSISSAQPANAGTYKAVITNSEGSATSYEAVVTVDLSSARPVITYVEGSRVVQGGAYPSMGIQVAPGIGTYTVAWKKSGVEVPNATSLSLSLSNFSAAMAGTYTAEVTTSTGTYTSRPIVLALQNSGSQPSIVRQPASQARRTGEYASFDVQTTGEAPFTYQWRKGSVDIPGANQPSYGISTLTTAHAGGYSVVVTNRQGSVTSDVATLTVSSADNSPPVISAHPASQAVSAGNSYFSLSVTVWNASGGNTFQWYQDGVALPNGTYSYYSSPSTVTAAMAGRYKVVVTNAAGSTTSEEALIAVTTRATGPTFTTQPADQTAYAGGAATFTAVASGGTVSYQWRKNGAAISGATSATLTLSNVQTSDAGNYSVLASNADGSTSSGIAILTIDPSAAPAITTQPTSKNALFGGSTSFTVAASGHPDPTYQWSRNNVAIAGATGPTLTLTNLQAADAGNYTVVASNPVGSVTSAIAILSLFTELPVPPSITAQPVSLSRPLGSSARFSVGAAGTSPLSIQWYKEGSPIGGATGATLTLSNVGRGDVGNYHAVATNDYGSAQSSAAALTIGFSAVAHVYTGTFSTGENWALVTYADGTGVFLGHLGSSAQAIVARDVIIDDAGNFSFGSAASAAALGSVHALSFEAPASERALANRLFTGRITGKITGSTLTGQLAGTAATLSGTEKTGTAAAGFAGWYDAVPLGTGLGELHAVAAPDGSLLLLEVDGAGVRAGTGTVSSTGAFTVTQTQFSYTGNLSIASGGLAGTYTPAGGIPVLFAASPASGTGLERLVNVSTRASAGTGSDTLIVGFVISGSTPKDVLVRAVGPTLHALGVTNYLANPRLRVFKGQTAILDNDDWSVGDAGGELAQTATRLGAYPLPAGSADAAVLAHLQPGVYTAHVTGPEGATGVALMEVYDASSTSVGAPKVVNLSARSHVGRGDDILIIGFVINGAVPKKVLIRGVGPTLADAGVTGVLADPKLKLFRNTTMLSENDNWSAGDAAQIIATATVVGASPLPAGSKDAALLVYLAPGVYTAHVSGVNDTEGVALVEVYEVP